MFYLFFFFSLTRSALNLSIGDCTILPDYNYSLPKHSKLIINQNSLNSKSISLIIYKEFSNGNYTKTYSTEYVLSYPQNVIFSLYFIYTSKKTTIKATYLDTNSLQCTNFQYLYGDNISFIYSSPSSLRNYNQEIFDNQSFCTVFQTKNQTSFKFFSVSMEEEDKIEIYDKNQNLLESFGSFSWSIIENCSFLIMKLNTSLSLNKIQNRLCGLDSDFLNNNNIFYNSTNSMQISKQIGIKQYNLEDSLFCKNLEITSYNSFINENPNDVSIYQIKSGNILVFTDTDNIDKYYNNPSLLYNTKAKYFIPFLTPNEIIINSFVNFEKTGFIIFESISSITYSLISYNNYSCDTFDIIAGYNPLFNIRNDDKGDVIMAPNQNICILFNDFTSPINNYSFYTKDIHLTSKMNLFEADGRMLYSMSTIDYFIINHTVIMQWMTSEEISGIAGVNGKQNSNSITFTVTNHSYKEKYKGNGQIHEEDFNYILISEDDDYSIDFRENIGFIFNKGLHIVFHNPYDFKAILSTNSQEKESILGDSQIYYVNSSDSNSFVLITEFLNTSKIESNDIKIYFTAIKININELKCSTFDIYSGNSTFFNIISKSSIGNMSTASYTTNCIVFSSPYDMKYTFFRTNDERSYFSFRGIKEKHFNYLRNSTTKLERLTYTGKTVIMKLEELYYNKGACGLLQTVPVINTHYSSFKYKLINSLLDIPYSFKYTSQNGTGQMSQYYNDTLYYYGDYSIIINSKKLEDAQVINTPIDSIVIFHNYQLFNIYAKTILDPDKKVQSYVFDYKNPIINYKQNTFLVYYQYEDVRTLLFSVIQPGPIKCETLDYWRGSETFFNVFTYNNTGNATINQFLYGKSHCVVFSSPETLKYTFYTSNITNNFIVDICDIENKCTSLKHTQQLSFQQKTVLFRYQHTSKFNDNDKWEAVGLLRTSRLTNDFEDLFVHDGLFISGANSLEAYEMGTKTAPPYDELFKKNYLKEGDYEVTVNKTSNIEYTLQNDQIIIFHNPFDFTAEINYFNTTTLTYQTDRILANTNIFHYKVPSNIFEPKIRIFISSQKEKLQSEILYFSVINIDYLYCETFDIFSGTDIYFNIRSDSTGNVIFKKFKSMCFCFSSPFDLNYTFYSDDLPDFAYLSIYSLDKERISSLQRTDTFSYQNKTCIVKFTSYSIVNGAAGLCQTSFDPENLPKDYETLHFLNKFLNISTSYLNQIELCGLGTAPSYTKHPEMQLITIKNTGDYEIIINYMAKISFFNTQMNPLLIFHNPNDFEFEISGNYYYTSVNGSICSSFKKQKLNNDTYYFNFSDYYSFDLSVIPLTSQYFLYFSFCQSNEMLYNCKTIDLWIGYQTLFNINEKTGNLTNTLQSENIRSCILFSSILDLEYTFYSAQESFDNIKIFNLDFYPLTTISSKRTFSIKSKSVIMQYNKNSYSKKNSQFGLFQTKIAGIPQSLTNDYLRNMKVDCLLTYSEPSSFKQNYLLHGTETEGNYSLFIEDDIIELSHGDYSYDIYNNINKSFNFPTFTVVIFYNVQKFNFFLSNMQNNLFKHKRTHQIQINQTDPLVLNITDINNVITISLKDSNLDKETIGFSVISYSLLECNTFDILIPPIKQEFTLSITTNEDNSSSKNTFIINPSYQQNCCLVLSSNPLETNPTYEYQTFPSYEQQNSEILIDFLFSDGNSIQTTKLIKNSTNAYVAILKFSSKYFEKYKRININSIYQNKENDFEEENIHFIQSNNSIFNYILFITAFEKYHFSSILEISNLSSFLNYSILDKIILAFIGILTITILIILFFIARDIYRQYTIIKLEEGIINEYKENYLLENISHDQTPGIEFVDDASENSSEINSSSNELHSFIDTMI